MALATDALDHVPDVMQEAGCDQRVRAAVLTREGRRLQGVLKLGHSITRVHKVSERFEEGEHPL
jgi:hypothetical protein